MWVIICESQSLAVRPAAVALCIAAFNLAASVLESKLLCVLQPLYHVVVLGVSFIAVVGRWHTNTLRASTGQRVFEATPSHLCVSVMCCNVHAAM